MTANVTEGQTVNLRAHQTSAPQGDRYDRLKMATDIIADDKHIATAEPPLNGEGVRAYSAGIAELRLLDGLTESDADSAMIMLLFDYPRGIDRMGWRIADVLSPEPTVKWDFDDVLDVARAMTNTLYLFLGVIAGVDEPSDDVDLQITEHDLPPVPTPAGDTEVSQIDVHTTVRVGEITAEVVRFVYWNHRDGKPLEVTWEVQVNGLPDGGGVADFTSETPELLADLAAVSTKAAEILRQVQDATP